MIRRLGEYALQINGPFVEVVGRGLFYAWVNLVILEQISLRPAESDYLFWLWMRSISSVVLILGIFSGLAIFRPSVFSKPFFVAVSSLVLPVGWFCCIWGQGVGVPIIGCVLMAIGSGSFMMSWADYYSRFESNQIFKRVPESLLVATIVYYVLYGAGSTIEAIVVAFLPLLSGACLLICLKRGPVPFPQKAADDDCCGRKGSIGDLVRKYWCAGIAFIAFSAISRFIRELIVSDAIGAEMQQINRCIFIATLLTSATLIVMSFRKNNSSLSMKTAALFVLPFVGIGLAFISVLDSYYIGYFLVCIGYTLFDLLATTALLLHSAKHSRYRVAFLGIGQFLLRAGLLIGTLAAYAVFTDSNWRGDTSGLSLVICALMLVVALPIMLQWVRGQNGPECAGNTLQDRIGHAARRYKLTMREAELYTYIAQGRSVDYAAKELHIAKSTAATHIGNLYKKLGVSNKQEALDILELIS